MALTPTSSNNHSDNLSSEAEPIDPCKRLKFSSWSSSAEEIVGNLDILIEILLRLPARSLVRFKCVSKQWRYLLLGTKFPSKHISCNPKPSISGLYYMWDTYPIPLHGHSLPTLTFLGTPGKSLGGGRVLYKIHDSRHGLILCSFYSPSGAPQIMVCNPTIQKYKIFHQRELDLCGEIPNSHFYLYLNPSISPIYKLILIIWRGLSYNISICASNRSFWKTISLEAELLWGHSLIHGVLSSDGTIYIITENWYLIRFDVETEKLSAARLTLEPHIPGDVMIGYFGERASGNLFIIVSNNLGPDFIVYEMVKLLEGQHWVLKHRINPTKELNNLREVHQPTGSHFAVMWVFWNGEDDERDLTFVLGVPEKAILYNHKSKETKVICNLPGFDNLHWETTYAYVHPFIGSFCAV